MYLAEYTLSPTGVYLAWYTLSPTDPCVTVICIVSFQTGGYKDDMLGSDDEGALDPYLERMKAEGKARDEVDLEDEDSSGESHNTVLSETSFLLHRILYCRSQIC